jgi:glutamate/tyrosine decarboxylase-like PLP-dependent enzyme
MAHPAELTGETDAVVSLVARESAAYLDGLADRPVRTGAAPSAAGLAGVLPREGVGAEAALAELVEHGFPAAVHSAGPRYFDFVIGGATPAALGADWLTAVLDQNVAMWESSPLGAEVEAIALGWLRELFALPAAWEGVITTGATAAHLVGLAAARRWWGLRHGVDVDADGVSGLPPLQVVSSSFVHASAVKALGILGLGRSHVTRVAAGADERVDLASVERELSALDGAPAVLIANAGEVNTGAFDPIAELASLAETYRAWLHVDAAFGLFAALAPGTAALLAGVERADSIATDGHKWLNVPYDCGIAFVRDGLDPAVFTSAAAYLSPADGAHRNHSYLAPESSTRARALAVWATLRAYGQDGYRAIVERHLELAQRLARGIDDAPELERLADVPLNIVCFRYRPVGLSEERLDAVNRALVEAIRVDGRVAVGVTTYAGKVAFRPTIVNWRTTEADVDLLVAVVREIGPLAVEAAADG